jgi:uncharacterized damage-inducible protein DinB
MELSAATAERYLRKAFAQMIHVAEGVTDDDLNRRPHGDHTNAIAALIIHCCEVTEMWIGHVALGRPSNRDRANEFSATATLDELRQRVDTALAQVSVDLAALDRGEGVDEGGRQFLLDGDTSDASVVVHVLEELFQHLGHIELNADAFGRG